MEGVDVAAVRALAQLSAEQVVAELRSESSRLELTKSLLNLLFNICFTRAIVLSRRQKTAFKTYDKLAVQLLERNKDSVQEKRCMLMRNPELVRLIAQTCPLLETNPESAER